MLSNQLKENITKSIVYGNTQRNSYGVFLPICSAIGQKAHVDRILDYLKGNKFFSRYTKYSYAYRVEEAPVVFITEKRNEQIKFLEGCHSDQTIEGSGDKLLHLLEKLSKKYVNIDIRNVFVAVIIDQKDPLKRFDSSNYRMIVQNCRELLNTLYHKVVKAELNLAKRQPNLLIDNQKTLVLKKCQLDLEVDVPEIQPTIQASRPNHIYSEGKPTFLQKAPLKTKVNSSMAEIRFLRDRSKTFEQQFEKLKSSFEPKDFEHLKFMAIYDKNPLICQVFQMLQIVEDINHLYLTTSYNFERLVQWKLERLDSKKLRRLSEMFISNKMLIVDNILRIDKVLAVLFSLIDLLMRNSKANFRIESLREKNQKTEANKPIETNVQE